MHRALSLSFLALTVGVGCVEEEPPPRTAAYGYAPEPPDEATNEQAFVAVDMPVAQDNFWELATPEVEAPPPPRPQSISLGYIGDEPLGGNGNSGAREAPWWRPFPPRWESDYYGYYGYGYGYGHRYGHRWR
jgi:hypothetical protein